MITWVIGAGGLLGSALTRQAGHRYSPGPVPWLDPTEAAAALHRHARSFEQHVGRDRWRVIWAAGAATTSTPADQAMKELEPFTGLITGLRSALPSSPGTFVLASSAGGIYAGSHHPPFTVITPPAPISPYGTLKLAQEELAADTLGPITNVLIARIGNLFGPGQNLGKLQGLVSHLAKASITRQPVNIFVPLETTRDYVYAEDAAEAILSSTAQPMEGASTRIEIVASGRGTSIGQLIRTMNEVTKRRIPVALGTHESSQAQAVDLRLVPTLQSADPTTLAAGMKSVHQDLLKRLQSAELAS